MLCSSAKFQACYLNMFYLDSLWKPLFLVGFFGVYIRLKANNQLSCYSSFQIKNRWFGLESVATTASYILHATLEIESQMFFLVVSRGNIILSPEKKETILKFDLKKYIHITFAGKLCNIPKENLGRCPLHWHAALGRQTTGVNLHVNVWKRKLSRSHS